MPKVLLHEILNQPIVHHGFLQIIVELLSGEEVDGLKAMFDMMDINKSGFITFEQFKNGLRKLGSQLGEHDIRQLMEAVSFDIYALYSVKVFSLEKNLYILLCIY